MITLTVGYKQQLGVIVKDAYGNVISNPPTPTWVFNNEFAVVDENGLLSAGTIVGTGQVTATINTGSGDISGFADVEIIAGAPASVDVVAIGDATV